MIEPGLRFLRVLLVAVLLTAAPTTGRAAVAAPLAAFASPASAEETALQVRAAGEAYNLLLDHFVRALDTSALVRAGWDQLARDAVGRAALPGPPPTVSGDRAADLEALRTALTEYLAQPNANPDGFVAVHSLIRGMVRFADEGHTYFLDPQRYRDYQSWTRGDNSYVGIGVSVSTRGPEPHIVDVYEDTPARDAGLQPNDVLVRIGGQPVAGLALDEMTSLVRGAAGTTVEVVVRRGADPTPLTFTVTRAQIRIQVVRQRLVDNDIGYLSLRGFPEPSVVDTFERNVDRFQAAGVQGLVLDLRGNSGGRIDVGTRLLSHFLPPGTSIYEEVGRTGENRPHFTRSGPQYDLPLVVLVDGGTASMGEIFASAVQEHGAARILGTTTSGSVAAAQVYPLPDGTALQVTVFEVLSADGKPLNKIGVVPDEVIEADPGLVAQDQDPVLRRAVEILRAQVKPDPAVLAGPSS